MKAGKQRKVRSIPRHHTSGLLNLWRFLKDELAAYPGRANTVIRCLLSSIIVIVISMTLQIPWLTLSLIVVFFITQSNIVITRLIGALFILGTNIAIAIAILLLKFTFDYPLMRILIASGLFFGCVYLMRVTKIGVVFFIIGIVIIYVQSFVDLMNQGESLVRMILWVWAAVNYSIIVTLLINTLFLPIEPAQQLKAEMHRQLQEVITILAMNADRFSTRFTSTFPVIQHGVFTLQKLLRLTTMRNASNRKQQALQQGALTLQKLLRFTTMRNATYRQHRAKHLACIATVSRLYGEANNLLAYQIVNETDALHELRAICLELDRAIMSDQVLEFTIPENVADIDTAKLSVPAAEMYHALQAFSGHISATTSVIASEQESPFLAPDAISDPAYIQFALKTLLTVLISYLFYNAIQWPGAHTIMLTSLIVAQPSLGATRQRGFLRIIGAMIGSAWALFAVVFILPHLDSIVGLLMVSLPALAFGSWVATGSERISYAGIQIMFTFALSILSNFGPTTDLTEIRDRLIGIFLGVGLSMFVHASIWPESESGTLRRNIAGILYTLSKLLKMPLGVFNSEKHLAQSHGFADSLTKLSNCETMLARVALEPGWQQSEGEGEQEQMVMQAQAVLAQTREILMAINAFQGELTTQADQLSKTLLDAADILQTQAAFQLNRYAENLVMEPPVIQPPLSISLDVMTRLCTNNESKNVAGNTRVLSCARRLVDRLSSLPSWATQDAGFSFFQETAR